LERKPKHSTFASCTWIKYLFFKLLLA